MSIGIERISIFPGRTFLSVERLFRARGLDLERFDNLMMDAKSVNLPCEDPVTNAVNAAKPLLDQLTATEIDDIELLVVGTESGLDFGKPISTYIHHHLALNKRCRSFEVKHACFGGTAALKTAMGIIANSGRPDAKALVISADASALPDRDTYWEPSQGAGAVAMLVGPDSAVLDPDDGAVGFYTYEVQDTARPTPRQEVGDSDLSLISYLRCLNETFSMYSERVADVDVLNTFTYLTLHTPFAGMVKGAHRNLLRRHAPHLDPDTVLADFETRVSPTLNYCRQVGNIYSAALYLALASLLEHGEFTSPRRVGLFSYGSGCASEFYSGIISPEGVARTAELKLPELINSRLELDMSQYEAISALTVDRLSGTEHADFPTREYQDVYDITHADRGHLVLESIRNYHRSYRWS